MSVLGTVPLVIAPPGTDPIHLLSSTTPYAPGPWVQLIASTGSACQLAGFMAGLHIGVGDSDPGTSAGSGRYEIQIGVGPLGGELSIGSFLVTSGPCGNCALETLMLPIPVDRIPVGSRVSARVGTNGMAAVPMHLAIHYYQSLDATTATTGTYTYAPYGQDGATITPNATPWANSAWVTLLAALPAGGALLGVAPEPQNFSPISDGTQWEIDLATGMAGSEVVVTTLRNFTPYPNAGQGFTNTYLPASYPITTTSRIAARLRKSNTSTATINVHLIFLNAPNAPPPPAPPPALVPRTVNIRRLRRTPHLNQTRRRIRFSTLTLLAEVGTGLPFGPGQNPQVVLRWSDDGGETWSGDHWTSLGQVGAYLTRVKWTQLGQARDRVFEVVVSDPVVAVLVNAFLDATIGPN